MSDQGLSIFDDNEPEEDETHAAGRRHAGDARRATAPGRAQPAAAGRPPPGRRTRRPRPGPRRPPPSRPPRPAARRRPGSLPVVRRGGYDREAVDEDVAGRSYPTDRSTHQHAARNVRRRAFLDAFALAALAELEDRWGRGGAG